MSWARQSSVVDSSYAVANFRFRLHFTTDSSVVYDGWYVDDFCVAPIASDPATYNEGFDASNGGYAVSGTTTTWAWGAPTSGPYAAHSGSYLWGTNLSGYYLDYEDGYITSPYIDLSGLSAEPTIPLSWWQWYYGESCCDYISTEVSNNGGSSWTVVYGPYNASSVTTSTWTQPTASLATAYAVSNFRIRFHFTSDYSVTYDGWYVDDIVIGTGISTSPACEP
jgi:bacillopeptidase F